MKKVFHKNQIVITTLAVLFAIAGYVSYDRKNAGADDEAKIVSNTDVLSQGAEADADSDMDLALEISDEDMVETMSTETDEIDNPGETVLTSAGTAASDYAARSEERRVGKECRL